jgi:hypothetical protein
MLKEFLVKFSSFRYRLREFQGSVSSFLSGTEFIIFGFLSAIIGTI